MIEVFSSLWAATLHTLWICQGSNTLWDYPEGVCALFLHTHWRSEGWRNSTWEGFSYLRGPGSGSNVQRPRVSWCPRHFAWGKHILLQGQLQPLSIHLSWKRGQTYVGPNSGVCVCMCFSFPFLKWNLVARWQLTIGKLMAMTGTEARRYFSMMSCPPATQRKSTVGISQEDSAQASARQWQRGTRYSESRAILNRILYNQCLSYSLTPTQERDTSAGRNFTKKEGVVYSTDNRPAVLDDRVTWNQFHEITPGFPWLMPLRQRL